MRLWNAPLVQYDITAAPTYQALRSSCINQEHVGPFLSWEYGYSVRVWTFLAFIEQLVSRMTQKKKKENSMSRRVWNSVLIADLLHALSEHETHLLSFRTKVCVCDPIS